MCTTTLAESDLPHLTMAWNLGCRSPFLTGVSNARVLPDCRLYRIPPEAGHLASGASGCPGRVRGRPNTCVFRFRATALQARRQADGGPRWTFAESHRPCSHRLGREAPCNREARGEMDDPTLGL